MKFNDLINLSPYKYFGLIEIGHWRGGGGLHQDVILN